MVGFLASADVGLVPILHYPSHEMAMTNKLFEYILAGLPLCVSDVRTQAEFVTARGLGTVHRAEDPADLARAAREALDRREELRAAVADPALRAEFSWAGQEAHIAEVYSQVLGLPLALAGDDFDEGVAERRRARARAGWPTCCTRAGWPGTEPRSAEAVTLRAHLAG